MRSKRERPGHGGAPTPRAPALGRRVGGAGGWRVGAAPHPCRAASLRPGPGVAGAPRPRCRRHMVQRVAAGTMHWAPAAGCPAGSSHGHTGQPHTCSHPPPPCPSAHMPAPLMAPAWSWTLPHLCPSSWSQATGATPPLAARPRLSLAPAATWALNVTPPGAHGRGVPVSGPASCTGTRSPSGTALYERAVTRTCDRVVCVLVSGRRSGGDGPSRPEAQGRPACWFPCARGFRPMSADPRPCDAGSPWGGQGRLAWSAPRFPEVCRHPAPATARHRARSDHPRLCSRFSGGRLQQGLQLEGCGHLGASRQTSLPRPGELVLPGPAAAPPECGGR